MKFHNEYGSYINVGVDGIDAKLNGCLREIYKQYPPANAMELFELEALIHSCVGGELAFQRLNIMVREQKKTKERKEQQYADSNS